MNALDELREIADLQERGLAFVEIGQLRQIADRIEAEYIELPKDADGVPCKIGDHVKSGETCGDIKEMLLFERGGKRWEIYLTTLDDSVPADSLHHVEPPKKLTKEDIDALAKKSGGDFWECKNMLCENCPSKIDGKKPKEYYGTTQCYDAKALHILRLERERVAGEQR